MKKYVMIVMILMFTLGLGACSNMHNDGNGVKHSSENAHDRSFDIIR